jgi:hypothetical protein
MSQHSPDLEHPRRQTRQHRADSGQVDYGKNPLPFDRRFNRR